MEHRLQRREPAHPTPFTYIKVAAVLGAITALEVVVFYMQALRPVVVPVFLALSATKFAGVVLFYMHLKFDSRLFSGLFAIGLVLAAAVIVALMALFRTMFA
ncbi:MAG: cytochrome C oxidase subunit IV family protein [Chloroflexi bacterium]|nr:cytochrome C oxidase subunit IV family protein [Chloroflexota bacterium]